MQTTANLVVKLGEANVELQDIMNLEIGDIIQLDRDATIPLNVLVEVFLKVFQVLLKAIVQ